MKYNVIRDQRSTGEFTPNGSKEVIHYDNRVLHVLYTDTDGKPSVDRIKVKTELLETYGLGSENLAGKIIEVEYGRFGSQPISVKVIGLQNK